LLHALEVILITLAENAVTKRRGNNGSGVNTIDAMLVSSVWVGLDDDSLARMTRRLLIVPVEQLLVENKPARRLSSFGYSSGLQNWDCTNLGAVSEILNLSRSDWVPVTLETFCMPHLRRSVCVSGHRLMWCESFPYVTFCANSSVHNSAECSFPIYSLRMHTAVESVIVASGIVHSFSSSDRLNHHCTFSPLTLSSDANFSHSVLLTRLHFMFSYSYHA
jgi:hypothetical protein